MSVPLHFRGYVLEPPRVGGANSPFTMTPNVVIADRAAFEAAFPSDESVPRAEYMVQILREADGAGSGPGGAVVLPDATFAWTKNEGAVQGGFQVPFRRFDYAGQGQRFETLRGAPRELVGVLTAASNTDRLQVSEVPPLADFAKFPVRLSVGASGSGETYAVQRVDSFGAPAPGTVEVDANGSLNWNDGDIGSNRGAPVYFQRQSFFKPEESTGKIGTLGSEPILLNPLPVAGQLPAVRIGERRYLVPVERANEGALSANPSAGSVEWARDTGRLRFNSADAQALAGHSVIYDGVFLGQFRVPVVNVGFAQAMPCGVLAALPAESSDVYFRIAGSVQFVETAFVDAFDANGKKGQVQIRRSDHAVQLSASDRATHSGATVQVVLPDIPIERGITLRLFRSPINPAATTEGAKDVTAFYFAEAATFADPMVGQPFVFPPALPREDEALTVRVEQRAGSFVGTLDRLDVAAPPLGMGFTLDPDARQLGYAERRSEILVAPTAAFSAFQLPRAPVLPTGLLLEIESAPGVGDFTPQVEDRDFSIDHGSGVVTELVTKGYALTSGIAIEMVGDTLEVVEDLMAAGVQSGDLLIVRDGPAEGLYTIRDIASHSAAVTPDFPASAPSTAYEIRRSKEILADRYFREVARVDPFTRVERVRALGAISSDPRLRINPALARRVRFRFGSSAFSTTVTVKSASEFAAAPLSSGEVEINEKTGELNFSAADMAGGATVYCVQTLVPGVEFRVQPELGFIEFSERMIEREEVLLEYGVFGPNDVKVPVSEPGVFLVRKELVEPHPSPTSVLRFNPAGRRLASTSAPRVFRGGRSQAPTRVAFDFEASTVTFLPDSQVTDALPHGPVIGPSENVYVDYYVLEALGGESSLAVSRPPIAPIEIAMLPKEPENAPHLAFSIEGDRRADFQPGVLEIDGSEVYMIAGSTFDGTSTTVALDQTSPQYFRTELSRQTAMRVSSGAVRPSYFVREDAGYDVVARGSKQIAIVGDQSRTYTAGTIVGFTAAGYQEYYRVEGSTFDAEMLLTVVVLSSGAARQYAAPTELLRSVRPILVSSVTAMMTSEPPVATLPLTVYRQLEGRPGVLLEADVDYTLDSSGRVTFTEPLGPNEEIGILYSGISRLEAGRRTRASWTAAVVPSVDNGMAGQALLADYTAYAPDTFFWRVETITAFRGELADDLRETAKAANPSQGPILENASETPLYEQGTPSLFFEEGHLDNQDLVARRTLQFYNNVVNSLESYFEGWDGRAVGDHDGRFLFDGEIDNPVRTHFAYATNQIDDLIQVFGTTPKRAFEAATYSRFYPTQRTRFGAAEDPDGLVTGDPILDLKEKALKAVLSVKTRAPWAVTTAAAAAGATVLQVDHAQGDGYLLRPSLSVAPGLKVAITTRDGQALVTDGAPAIVSSTTGTSVTLTAPLAVAVPKGSTIRMASQDDVYRQVFNLGIDVGVDTDSGFLTHVASADVPVAFAPNSNPTASMPLDVVLQTVPTNTVPERFPALDGATIDDDGNRQFPVLGGGGELGAIADELALIAAGTGSLATIVRASLISPGTVLAPALIDRGAAWSSPVPKVGDLIRIVSGGPAGVSDFHRVTAVVGTTVSFEPSLDFDAGVVTFEITTGSAIASGAATLLTTTVLEVASGNLVSLGVRPGYTVVITSGATTLVGQRRQVVTVTATQVTVDSAFATTGAVEYDIVNSLATYGGTSASLQDEWTTALDLQLRALEGHDLIDFSERIVAQQTAIQSITVSDLNMGTFSTLLVFVAIEQGANSSVASVTFAGSPLTNLYATSSGQNLGVHVYLGQGLAGVSGDLVTTAVSIGVDMKVFGLKLSAMRHVSAVAEGSVAAPAILTTSGVAAVEAGDLVVSFLCSASPESRFYSVESHETLIPKFSGNSTSAMLTASRANSAGPITKTFFVGGEGTTARAVTLVLTKDSASDAPASREVPERVALSRFIEDAVDASMISSDMIEEAEAALARVEAAIVNTGSLRLQLECPIPVYRTATAIDAPATTASRRLVLRGAHARPISGLSARRIFLSARINNAVQALQNILSAGELYDARYAWIDGRINLETGILPRKDRAVQNRLKALENIVKNLTRLLTL